MVERRRFPHLQSCRANFMIVPCILVFVVIYLTYRPLQCPERKYMPRKEVHSVDFIDIIGIGVYTWHHLLNGSLDVSDEKVKIYNSNKTIDGVEFKYKLKCCFPKPPADFSIENKERNVILALWGRSDGRTQNVKLIKQLLADKNIRNLALLIFGDLQCKDDYIKEFIRDPKLRFIYITHESNMIDEKRIFLWPLGTQMAAGHKVRHNSPFINPGPVQVDINTTRKYTSTFSGNIWNHRKPMAEVVKKSLDNERQLITFLPRWKEQKKLIEDGDEYEYTLRNSDLTLSPRGMAAECYRTFEALELGSIPIISNIVPAKSCIIPHEHNDTIQSPNRIFKLHDAPLHYINNWGKELPKIITDFEKLSDEGKRSKRRQVHEWYKKFKVDLGRKLINDVKRFFV